MILGIDASRARSGGAKAHLIGIMTVGDRTADEFSEFHIWSFRELLDALPERPRMSKNCSPYNATNLAITLGHLEKPAIRRSREGGSPVKSSHWIPAFAGMTGFSRRPLVEKIWVTVLVKR